MGNADLKKIRAGSMDPEGEQTTNIGKILGMITTILSAIGCVVGCIGLGIWIAAVGFLVSQDEKLKPVFEKINNPANKPGGLNDDDFRIK